MKKSNFKKFLCGMISASMLLSALPMSMAQAAMDTDDVIVLYEDYYEDAATGKTGYKSDTVTTTKELADDPTGIENKVMNVSTTGVADDSSYSFNISLTDQTHWNIWSGSDEAFDTYAEKGAVEGRPLVFSLDMYIPESFMNELSLTDDYWSELNFGPQFGGALNQPGLLFPFGIGGSGHSSIDGPWMGATRSDTDAKPITADEWHTFTWVVEGTGDETVANLYVDDTRMYSKKAKNSEVGYYGYDPDYIFSGISINAKYNADDVLPDGSHLFVDNLKIYQPKTDLTADLAFDEEAKTATLTFNNNIPAAMASKIAVTGLTAGTDYNVSVSGKTAEITFADLTANTTYTVTTTDLLDEYYQPLSVNEYTFTTEPSPITYLYQDTYDSVVSGRKETKSTKTEITDDPSNENNTVMKLSATGSTDSNYNTYINASLTNVTGNEWASAWSTYYDHGYIDGRPVIYEVDVYVPENDFFAQLKDEDGNYTYSKYNPTLKMGPQYGSPDTSLRVRYMVDFGVSTGKNNEVTGLSGTPWVGANNWDSSSKATTLDAWNTYKWVVEGTGADTTVTTYVNDVKVHNKKAVASATQGFDPTKGFMGIKVSVGSGDVPAEIKADSAIYVDNAKIYQISKAFDAELDFDQLTATGKINFTQKLTEADLASIIIKNAAGTAVAANKELSSNGKTVSFSFDTALESAAVYTVDVSALVDGFGQSIETETLTFTSAKNPIKMLYSEDYEDSYNVLVTYGAVSKHKTVTMTDKDGNADNSVVNIYSTGEINNDNPHYLNAYMTDQTSVWGGAKTYSAYSDFVSGRPIVYEADVYVTEAFEAAVPVHWSAATAFGPTINKGNAIVNMSAVKTHFVRHGVGGALLYGVNQADRKTFPLNTWNSLKWIIEPLNDGENTATLTAYLNDTKITTETVTFNPETAKMYGINFGRASDGAAVPEDSVFVDNVKIWQCESEFGLTEAVYDPDEGAILVKTGTRPTQATINAITLKLGETNVTSLITSRVWDDTNSALKLYVPFESLNVSAEYTVTMPANSADEFGQTTTAEQTATFITPKSKSISITAKTVTAEPSSSGASVDVTLQNGSLVEGEAWVVMAVYGEYNELLGIDPQTVELAASASDTKTFTTTADCTGAEEIRIYVWDTPENMVPLQNNELAWSAE